MPIDAGQRATREALRSSFKVFLPFLIAFLFWQWQRVDRYYQAALDLRSVALRFEDDQKRTTEKLVEEVFGDSVSGEADRNQLRRIARTLKFHRDFFRQPGQLADLQTSIPKLLWEDPGFSKGLGYGFCMQAIMIFLFPGLFVTRFWHAQRAVKRNLGRTSAWRDFTRDVAHRRAVRFLEAEGESFFFRRLGFAFFVGLAASEMLAPAGIRVAAISEFLREHSIPGSAPSQSWVNEVRSATPLAIGFAGYYLYAATVFVQRFMRRELTHRMVVSLFLRGMVVMILTFTVSAVAGSEASGKSLVFLAAIASLGSCSPPLCFST
jgi:hypothetical protein